VRFKNKFGLLYVKLIGESRVIPEEKLMKPAESALIVTAINY
jgi:hypothetical protein